MSLRVEVDCGDVIAALRQTIAAPRLHENGERQLKALHSLLCQSKPRLQYTIVLE